MDVLKSRKKSAKSQNH